MLSRCSATSDEYIFVLFLFVVLKRGVVVYGVIYFEKMPALKKIPINAYVAWCPSSPYDTVMGLGHRHVGGARLDFVSLDLASVSPADYTVSSKSSFCVLVVCCKV